MKNEPIYLAQPKLTDHDIQNVVDVLKSGMLVQGKYVKLVERRICEYTQAHNASLLSNGTATLHLALVALGIGKGDEVIVPAFSYVATANVVELVGAKPIFVDIKAGTFNINENLIEEAITPKTKAIIPVHEFGLCACMDKIMDIATKHQLFVIEDAACAIGAMYKDQQAGTFGHFGSFSFHPRKSVTSGEGGCLTTNNTQLNLKIKTLRNHGLDPQNAKIDCIEAGYNYRMTDIQAALLSGQIERLDAIISYKAELAQIYATEIQHPAIYLPQQPPKHKHTWQTYHITLKNQNERDKLINHLKINNIFVNYGAQCIPAMSYYKNKYNLAYEQWFPQAYKAYTCGLALPVHEMLQNRHIQHISSLINTFSSTQ